MHMSESQRQINFTKIKLELNYFYDHLHDTENIIDSVSVEIALFLE